MALPTGRTALIAALALAAAPAAAQPSADGRYHVIDLGHDTISYVDEASMGHEGARRGVWMLRVTRAPVTVAGQSLRVSKSMFIVDCDRMTLHNEAFVFWQADGSTRRVDLGKGGDTNAIRPGSTGAVIADFVCKDMLDPKLKALPVLDEAKAVQAATLLFDQGSN
jgi:hypothetical protein